MSSSVLSISPGIWGIGDSWCTGSGAHSMNHPAYYHNCHLGLLRGVCLADDCHALYVSPKIKETLGVKGSLRPLPRSTILRVSDSPLCTPELGHGKTGFSKQVIQLWDKSLEGDLGVGKYWVWAAAMTTSSGTPFPARLVSAVR